MKDFTESRCCAELVGWAFLESRRRSGVLQGDCEDAGQGSELGFRAGREWEVWADHYVWGGGARRGWRGEGGRLGRSRSCWIGRKVDLNGSRSCGETSLLKMNSSFFGEDGRREPDVAAGCVRVAVVTGTGQGWAEK